MCTELHKNLPVLVIPSLCSLLCHSHTKSHLPSEAIFSGQHSLWIWADGNMCGSIHPLLAFLLLCLYLIYCFGWLTTYYLSVTSSIILPPTLGKHEQNYFRHCMQDLMWAVWKVQVLLWTFGREQLVDLLLWGTDELSTRMAIYSSQPCIRPLFVHCLVYTWSSQVLNCDHDNRCINHCTITLYLMTYKLDHLFI